MTLVKEILTLDLQEDIKNVIDLEDTNEAEIQQEIESYIVTEGLGQHLYSFLNQFTSNIKETGVWLSGFYGSGKSYFGKMLGYMIDNRIINGTPARERFIPRLKGVSNESLIENSIRNLDAIKSRVIFLDVAKQNTDRGLAFTLFTNLLKNLGFRDDLYGYIEFDFFIDGKLDELKSIVKRIEGKDWNAIKTNNRLIAKLMRTVFAEMGYSDADYSDTQNVYSSAIQDFSAAKFKIELEKYLKVQSDETLVFVFDEASEAIGQKKFTLLDLEGISEALSSISTKVWTIAIAQEKLDDVINNANVNRSQLTKVTDRFKTKVHLESTEVDVIIRSRLLHKTDSARQQLIDYYKKHDGLVADATNLKSSFPTKTTNAEEFATYYPFHRYQFDILQKFLFSSNALVATQIAARGMIITTFDVLRRHMQQKELYEFAPGYVVCTEAQTAPPIGLVNKYDTARKMLNDRGSDLDGEKLLKTIHLLADSEVVFPTVENITKSYISDLKAYYAVKPLIEDALHLLVEAKVLLLSNNNYKITSDLEGKLLEEMKIDVELFSKKRTLITSIKNYKLFSPISALTEGTDSFKFNILSDQDDELSGPGNKQLKMMVYNLFNISENRQNFIERIKLETQSQKDLITLIPNNEDFAQIDKLIVEISRYLYVEDKYSDESDPLKRQIIRDFSIIREEKEKELRLNIEQAYKNASLVYMFDEHLLNDDTFKGTITEIQRKVVKNIYTKRLGGQLSEALVPKIFSSRRDGLAKLFSGDDFKFFDTHGTFVGNNLKVVEEINAIVKNRYVDGKTLESDLSGAPWGYSFGTIVTTLASLFRAGKVSVKYNGDTWLSYEHKTIQEAFTNTTKFKSASFKSITSSLTAAQKDQTVQLLMNLEIERHTARKVDWNINDFDLAATIVFVAEHFVGALTTLKDSVDQFELLFPTVANQKQVLQAYAGKVTEGNYIEKVEYFLANSSEFCTSVETILKAEKFIKNNFSNVKIYKRFIEDVLSELKKAERFEPTINEAAAEFSRLYSQDMVKTFGALQQQAQAVKDSYYKLMKNAANAMNHAYQSLDGKVDVALLQLKQKYPQELNVDSQRKLNDLKRYCTDRIKLDPVLEYSTHCKNSGYSLSDILNYSALAPSKETELLVIQNSFISKAPPPNGESDESDEPPRQKPARILKLQILNRVMTVQQYKSWLTAQLASIAGASPDEEIEIDLEPVQNNS
jgi:hypothetical protein